MTTHGDLETVAFDLFAERGYDDTTVDDIAAAAGIARRTFFRYYRSKADVVWGDFDAELDRFRAWLGGVDADMPMMTAIHQAVTDFNRLPADQIAQHRRRMSLILGVPTLLANSTLRFSQWRAAVAEFAARRLGSDPDDLLPNVVAYSALGAALAAYDQWLRDDRADLVATIDRALGELASGFHQTDCPGGQ